MGQTFGRSDDQEDGKGGKDVLGVITYLLKEVRMYLE